jgi:alpha-1,6-mannosyltransferase
VSSSALTFCDIAALWAPTGGGIRTYYEEKLQWFASQLHHRYVLIRPGQRPGFQRVSDSASIVTVYGIPVGGGGYRVPLYLPTLAAWVRQLRPHILETADPWFSGPMGLLAKRRGHTQLVSSFFHGEPIGTYVAPWAARGLGQSLRGAALARADRAFFRVQRMYDLTVTSSPWIERLLKGRGVRDVLISTFGVDRRFLDVGHRRCQESNREGRRLLFAGRLQRDKGIELVLAAIPALLADGRTSLTIAGAGPALDECQRAAGDRVRVVGYVRGRDEMASLYARHDVLLSPGAHETFGLAALEALAAGLLVVGPSAAGTHELISQLSQAYTFAAGDLDAFVSAAKAAATSQTRHVDVEAAVALAERYGTWPDAIARGVANYCSYWSRSTM